MTRRLAPGHWAFFVYALALLVVQPARLDGFFTPTWPEGLPKDLAMLYCLGAGMAMLAAVVAAAYKHYNGAKRFGLCGVAAMLLLVLYNMYRLMLLRQPLIDWLWQAIHLAVLAALAVWLVRACDAKLAEKNL